MPTSVRFVRVLVSGVTASVLAASVLTPAQASASGELQLLDRSWIPPVPTSVEEFTTRYVINDMYMESWGYSQVHGFTEWDKRADDGSPLFDSAHCDSHTDSECSGDTRFHVQLPLCDAEVTWNCIAGLTVESAGAPARTSFARYLDLSGRADTRLIGQPGWNEGVITSAHPAADFAGIPDRDLPPGGRVSLWTVEGVAEAQSNSFFAADVVLSGARDGDTGEVTLESFHAGVLPVRAIPKAVPEEYAPSILELNYEDGRRSLSGIGGGGAWLDNECRYPDRAYCLQQSSFPSDVRITMDLRLSKSISGWLHGRLDSPEVNIAEVDTLTNLVTIAGNPVSLPLAVTDIADSMMPSDLGSPQWWKDLVEDPQLWTWNLFADGEFRFDWVRRVLAYFDDQSDFEVSVWLVRGVFRHEARCMTSDSQLLGLVTTNSMMYSGLPPVFTDNRLEYRVAGMHRRPDGSLTRGSYDLIMRTSVARCLYGLSNAPIRAEVSVVGEDGEEQVATTAVRQDREWISLRATNFTFSSPRIVVTFDQPRRITTVCVKRNKAVKGPKRVKVKGTTDAPGKCPKGYRPKKKG